MSPTMQAITYSLKDDQAQSEQYFRDVATFADQVIAAGEARAPRVLQSFEAFVREAVRTRAEYLYEFLTLGVL
ncbi:MAG: hypothetical protein L0Y55_15720, partial [Anaerolineales bacterium]|nr:hypothetical protein [Anaerolineales bacterium]